MNSNRAIWPGLVAVEGIDGAGTTTLTRNLSAALLERDRKVQSGCEPTGGSIGRLIREGLAGREPMQPESLALLFSADRREHLYSPGGIQDFLEEGDWYISDRYLFSSLAYQSLNTDWDWVNSLNLPYPLPGYLIYLGLPVDEAMKRISGRAEQDIFETETLQQKVSSLYDRSIEAYRDTAMRILVLDSRQSPAEICRQALEFLLQDSE